MADDWMHGICRTLAVVEVQRIWSVRSRDTVETSATEVSRRGQIDALAV